MSYSQAIKTVIENRKRIINESIGIIERSTNIETVVSRKNVLIENIDWFIEAERNDHRINSNPPPYILKDQVIRLFNDKLFDLIKGNVEVLLSKIDFSKSSTSKQEYLNKAINTINSNIEKFDRSESSFSYRIESKIRNLYKRIESITIES